MRLFKVLAMIFYFLGFPSVPKIISMIGNIISTTSIYFKKWDDINKYSIIIVFLINIMNINDMLYIKAYEISIQTVMCTIDL
ncbi:hypothetical protein BK740_03900 [Bacillus thuringiensis serovar argentinensis]|nr:hypothetical protein BK740_03900 [Bacillus thuringiensis serovar argentinensis]